MNDEDMQREHAIMEAVCQVCGINYFGNLCPRCHERPTVDHGISPAQLREKVEALEREVSMFQKACRHYDGQLIAALKRIEQLEQQLATLDKRTFAELARDMSRPSAPIDDEEL